MADFRGDSREVWTSAKTVEHINAGSLQRIADATEAKKTSAMPRNGYTKRFQKVATRYRLSGGMDGSNAQTSGETRLNTPANAD